MVYNSNGGIHCFTNSLRTCISEKVYLLHHKINNVDHKYKKKLSKWRKRELVNEKFGTAFTFCQFTQYWISPCSKENQTDLCSISRKKLIKKLFNVKCYLFIYLFIYLFRNRVWGGGRGRSLKPNSLNCFI